MRSGVTVLVLAPLVALVVASLLVASERLRPYAVGFVITLAAVVVVLGGACVGLIALLATGYS
jgi:hypothetical protein